MQNSLPEFMSDNTSQPGVCSSLGDELAASFWSPSRYGDGAKKATEDSTNQLIMKCGLPLCWSSAGNKQRSGNERSALRALLAGMQFTFETKRNRTQQLAITGWVD